MSVLSKRLLGCCSEVFTVALPIVAEYGFAVGVFQHGWLEWAGIPSTGSDGSSFLLCNFSKLFCSAGMFEALLACLSLCGIK